MQQLANPRSPGKMANCVCACVCVRMYARACLVDFVSSLLCNSFLNSTEKELIKLVYTC